MEFVVVGTVSFCAGFALVSAISFMGNRRAEERKLKNKLQWMRHEDGSLVFKDDK